MYYFTKAKSNYYVLEEMNSCDKGQKVISDSEVVKVQPVDIKQAASNDDAFLNSKVETGPPGD